MYFANFALWQMSLFECNSFPTVLHFNKVNFEFQKYKWYFYLIIFGKCFVPFKVVHTGKISNHENIENDPAIYSEVRWYVVEDCIAMF